MADSRKIDLLAEARIVAKFFQFSGSKALEDIYVAPEGYRQDFTVYYSGLPGQSGTMDLADLKWDVTENWGVISDSLRGVIKSVFRVREDEKGFLISLL